MSAFEGRFHLDEPAASAFSCRGARLRRLEPGLALAFDGALYNAAELRSRLGAADEDEEALILKGYRAWGPSLWERLDGDFALALHDAPGGRLWLVRDAIGVRPLHYALRGRTLAFATRIAPLLEGTTPEPDEAHAAAFLLRRVYDPSRTFFKGLRSVRPSHRLKAERGGVEERPYWDFEPARRSGIRDFGEASEAFGALFASAVHRRLPRRGAAGVSVSGGLDSSAVYARALADGGRVLGLALAPGDGGPMDEEAWLGELDPLGPERVVRLRLQAPDLLGQAGEQVRSAEAPALDELWGPRRCLLRAARARGCEVLLSGHFGDQVLFNEFYLLDLARGLRWPRCISELREAGRWLGDVPPLALPRALARDLVLEVLPRSLLKALRRLKSAPAAGAYAAAFASQARGIPGPEARWAHRGSCYSRSVYDTVRNGWYVYGLEAAAKLGELEGPRPAFPYLDRELLVFLMALPGELHAFKGVPKALLRSSQRGVLPEAIRLRRDKGDATAWVLEAARLEPASLRARLLGGSARSRGWLDQAGLRRALESIESALGRPGAPSAAPAWELSDLLALEAWTVAFFDAPAPAEARPPLMAQEARHA